MSTDQTTQPASTPSVHKAIVDDRDGNKIFTFRNLDIGLHTTWKTCAAMRGLSMEEFGVLALKEYIKKAIEGGKKVVE